VSGLCGASFFLVPFSGLFDSRSHTVDDVCSWVLVTIPYPPLCLSSSLRTLATSAPPLSSSRRGSLPVDSGSPALSATVSPHSRSRAFALRLAC